MTHPSPAPSLAPPDWPHCGHGTTSEDPVGCRGIHVPGHTACLAHLTDLDRGAYLAGLAPGSDIDHCGTAFTEPLLGALLDALRDPATGHPCFGSAWFNSVTFQGAARFESATFQDTAQFNSATFHGPAEFDSATFQDSAEFDMAIFQGTANFKSATFQDTAWFDSATFSGDTEFALATSTNRAWFRRARFEMTAYMSFTSGGLVMLDGAVFHQPVSVFIVTRRVSCGRTRWAATATLHLLFAELHLNDAVFEHPVVVTGSRGALSREDLLPEGLDDQFQGVGDPSAAPR
ncbi:pentapeptide repeat-containing protein [Streptomyces pseudovenezuelae]|uniref:Pentapeptide repeat-containing protein n=1 Tax=Streptomyces pseudovenezuelae TaxID=67350 RepID=A0ABT6LYR7_9ACTN|nr:pentapeptide repeat-containing protein [Streptomyces pseudovenezuelae]MDH6221439.1 hypothetical protein [Streptomyces pseudovenezuelae]